jgi:DNA polymerase III sliding clamp (beta) subunit (PCNA family)
MTPEEAIAKEAEWKTEIDEAGLLVNEHHGDIWQFHSLENDYNDFRAESFPILAQGYTAMKERVEFLEKALKQATRRAEIETAKGVTTGIKFIVSHETEWRACLTRELAKYLEEKNG